MAKLILTQEVSGLGTPGDVVDVKNGYARNYLLPRGFAVAWSKGGEKQVENIKAARKAREVANLDDAKALKATLESKPVVLAVKAGENGRLFGTVTPAVVADAVAATGEATVDRRKVEIPKHIKSLGNYQATVRIHEDVLATIDLQVVAG